jgi:anti-sigma factor RsiW
MDDRLPGHENVEAFVIGALDWSERSLFEAHLAGCASCQSAVASYRPCISALESIRAGGGGRTWERYRA